MGRAVGRWSGVPGVSGHDYCVQAIGMPRFKLLIGHISSAALTVFENTFACTTVSSIPS